jgi:hypothetical protein
VIVIDDRLLFDVLAGTETTQLLQLSTNGVPSERARYVQEAIFEVSS